MCMYLKKQGQGGSKNLGELFHFAANGTSQFKQCGILTPMPEQLQAPF